MEAEMTEGTAEGLRWQERVQETFQALRWADRDAQEQACKSIEEELGGGEAGKKLRELFETEAVKVAERAAEITADIENAEAKDEKTRVEEPKAEVEFHESDFAPEIQPLPTIEQKHRMLEELADLWESDPIQYEKKKKEAADRLDVSRAVVEEGVKRIRDGRPRKEEQSQATRLMAIGFGEGVQLWHSPDGHGHASVWVDGHWEHYRIKSKAFDDWLRGEYGRANQVKVGDRWVPQVPGTQAVR